MHVSPVLAAQASYPFVRIEDAKRRKAAEGVRIFDFGMGDPREPTDPLIKRALAARPGRGNGLPRAPSGCPSFARRSPAGSGGASASSLDPDRELIPTLGSKEAIFLFAQVVLDAESGKELVLVPSPATRSTSAARSSPARRSGTVPLLAENDFLPDLDAVDDETWSRAAIVWVCYPNNPTGAVAPLSFYERLAETAREHDVLVCSDEAYTELWFDEPHRPPRCRSTTARTLVVFNTLSKRSSMTGYRCGFVAGDRGRDRVAPQVPAQRRHGAAGVRAAGVGIAAWGDEAHVERNRALYARKRELLLDVFARKGVTLAGSEATMYLWVDVPGGETSESFADRLLEHGVVVAPGSYFGRAGEGYVRFALVPTEQECAEAAALLEEILLSLAHEIERAVGGPGPVTGFGGRRDDRRARPRRASRRREARTASGSSNEWVKKAILLYFRLRRMEPIELGPFEYHDKIPLKRDHAARGVRVVPPATARYGSFLSPDVVLMPSYVNIGAWVGPRTMVDTWATVGSCAQIGADVHLAGGVGIGGVLEPPQRAAGDRRGRRVHRLALHRHRGRRSSVKARCSVRTSCSPPRCPIIDVTGEQPVEHRGYVPPRSVVIPGTRPKEFPAGTYDLACALIVGTRSETTDLKTSLNDALREHGIAT